MLFVDIKNTNKITCIATANPFYDGCALQTTMALDALFTLAMVLFHDTLIAWKVLFCPSPFPCHFPCGACKSLGKFPGGLPLRLEFRPLSGNLPVNMAAYASSEGRKLTCNNRLHRLGIDLQPSILRLQREQHIHLLRKSRRLANCIS